ncbi:ABC-type transport system periplasmic substrate-binding protein (probable substrate dipeptide/oligopeptide) [Natrialba magadii ATCC 43099]|uniref:ABC-type transport system periplasmic substrate-binding protein (Probable substrate dipeptide/oligopeptide) n=1 Tax=Natrialba magadii (strain ATCC 43099 / DSM 3394 / CCM 3739 / CIP 104546 / IAM 13178 / JCM 8861 / NBRC 102185 / NCIMB 2190 / MS3) TaxID=547559 RepID=D3SRX7_NATMM|nr:ABC transporter substrate-binding protein [Natrialba magadii]ADD06751.1 ABC-type transport system periplasmic substrate-binding protein (probable substrate dipeptide/oligopeptide) [Natrialba magadii ATCC 43099]ELY27813.1 family 5 extracellular solute-binding protein [Natrialba magadii ATCC 43099]
MNSMSGDADTGYSRRSLLAAGATGLSIAASGCIDRVQSVVDPDASEQLSLSILSLPAADGDRETAEIARHLESNLEAVGINATISTRSESEFLEAILIDHDFDLYVGRHPADFDPDFLYETLHSTYEYDRGWQNPFGFTDPLSIDPLLERQRNETSANRERTVTALLEAIAQVKPFEPICVSNEYRAVRTDRFDGWDETHLGTGRGYLGLEPDAASDAEQLRALVTDQRLTQTFNPLSPTTREQGVIVDLLYDSLAVPTWSVPDEAEATDEETRAGAEVIDAANVSIEPWLATDWEWDGEDRTMTVDIREDCLFHDHSEDGDDTDADTGDSNGNDSAIPLTAEDVRFTYRFLADTTYGRTSSASPAPRYKGHASAVDSVTVEDDYRVTISFSTDRAVAERALTVPILPSGSDSPWITHLENSVESTDDDWSPTQGDWSIVTTGHAPPTGSGPYKYDSHDAGESVTLTRFEDHFTLRDDDHDLPAPTADELHFEVDPGTSSSIERVASGDADITTSVLDTYALESTVDDDAVSFVESPSWSFYHVGFNTRNTPCGSPNFRRAVSQLIDKQWIVDEVFAAEDSARPVATPVAEEWTPDSLAWDDGELVTTFVGEDGELDVDAARELFASHFEYDDGALVR